MIQKELYLKDIERHIEGVIKADDEEFIAQEVEEYVITKEVEKHLGNFFSEYVKKNFKDSAWISGFFGSGKSHLLKMLSLVLENKDINGKKCGDVFARKIKDDFELSDNIKRAVGIPSKTLLFNIAQKADGIGNLNNIDPILAVFLKVFNEHLGYYGQSPAIAEVERHMEEEGVYDKFQEIYHRMNNKEWLSGRKHILLNRSEFAKAYAELKGTSEEEAKKNFDDIRSHFKLDIEGFVELINKYLKKRGPAFRLIFCVDEVGQFIADDVRLMLSLQTLAESLTTGCKGQAFLIVTSQNDINATIGDLNARQAHDFSRIQGRFVLKLPLTSANADEVIQKRLLDKNDSGKKILTDLYQLEKNNLKTLFDFVDNSRLYSHYKSEEHFYLTYPFIPYQFELFSASIKALSDHNAFTGRQQSVGERSMLGVFQTVAKSCSSGEIGTVVPFSKMYDGIRDILQANIQTDIIQAEKSLGNVLAIEVLKALFMVKYIKGFIATPSNISILLLPSFDVKLGAFQKQVKEALNLLENQTYVQRLGEVYEFLTNQEKDVENEIKSTEIEPDAAGNLLADLLFNDVLRDSKVKLDSNNQIYEFGRKIDDVLIGRDKDFYVNFITPLNPNSITQANVAMKSMGNTDMIVHLPDDSRLLEELNLNIKTTKYIQTNNASGLDQAKQRILSERAQQNTIRKGKLLEHLKVQVGIAKMYLNGTSADDIAAKDPKTKITLGVQQLIKMVYPSLGMLVVNFSEEDIPKIIDNRDSVLFTDELSTIEVEVLNRINRNKIAHERTTIKSLLDFFSARPYGWYQASVLCLIAKLYKRNKVSLKKDGTSLNDTSAKESLKSNREYANTIIELEEEISNAQMKKLKDFHKEYFNETNLGIEPKGVSRLFKLRLQKDLEDLTAIRNQNYNFRFLVRLDDAIIHIKAVTEKDHPYFYTAFNDFSDGLLDDKENLIDPIRRFMNGDQKKIFEDIKLFLESQNANFNYISKEDVAALNRVNEDPAPYKGSIMRDAKETIENIRKEILSLLKTERENALKEVGLCIDRIKETGDYNKINDIQKEALLKSFTEAIEQIQKECFIGNIRTKANFITNDLYTRSLEQLEMLANPPKFELKNDDTPPSEPQIPRFTYVNSKSIRVKYSKAALETEEDVTIYVNELKAEYIRIIKDNKRISL